MIFKKIKENPKFFAGLKTASVTIFSVFAVLYLAFLFILPNVININKFAPQISNEISKLTDFGFELDNPKLQTSWKLGIKFKADKISLKYKDGSDFANLIEPSLEINLPTLLLKHLNLDKIYAKEANIALVFTKDKKYTLEKHILKMLPQNTNTPREEQEENQPLPIEIRNINIISDSAKLTLKDENLNKTYIIRADNSKINLASLNGPLKIKTSGYIGTIGSDKNFVDFNINLQTKLPEFSDNSPKKPEETPQFKFDFNPFESIDMFALRSKLHADLKIHELGDNFRAKGYINLDSITLKINNYQLPEGYVKTSFDKNIVNTDSKIYLSKDEFISTLAQLSAGKKSKITLSAKTDKISLSNVKTLCQSLLDMFSIKNELDKISVNGHFNCDFDLKSNFKTVQSSGNLKLADGNIQYPKIGLSLTQINSFLDFAGNKITIKDTNTLINDSKFDVSGTINSDSKMDIKITSDPLKITDIVKLATQFKVVKTSDIKDFDFTGGTILLLVTAKGDLENIMPKAKIEINNPTLTVKSLKMPVSLSKASINVEPDKKDFIAKINVKGFKASMKNPVFNISADNCIINANSKTLDIMPFNLAGQGSTINISGKVRDYMSAPDISIAANGKIHPNTILTFVPANNRKYIAHAGQMPFSANINGALDNLKIQSHITSNPQNYISIIDIKNIRGVENTLNADLVLKGENLTLNGINLNSKGTKIASLSGRAGKIYSPEPVLSPINVVIPQKLAISIPAIGKLSLLTDANIAITGTALKPQITGSANVSELNYPEFKASVANAYLDFKKSQLNARADGIKIAGSDFSGDAVVSMDFSKGFLINNLNFNSNYTDADALMNLMSSMPNTQTTAGPAVDATIKSGKGKITKLKSGTIVAQNISFDFNLYNNLFKLTNLLATFADGKITGEATYNIANTKVTVDGIAKALDVRKAGSAFVGASSLILSGDLNGMAKLNFRGTTYEQQMRTLNGQVKFDISNGQLGDAARFERFLQAGNLLSQSVLNLNLNQTVSAVTSRNTGEFKKMEGTLSITNGWANITDFKSSGPNMSLYATGKYNILTGNSDLKILGRISSVIVNVLGPLGSFSIDKMFDKLSPKGLAVISTLKAITPTNPLFAEINKTDLAKIPPLSEVSQNTSAKDFQVLINGPVSKTTSVKSFKWANKELPENAPVATTP